MITDHVRLICKLGKGQKCCRYLVVGSKGLECMKVDPDNRKVIDQSWATTNHVAQGDNCTGISNFSILNVPNNENTV